MPVYQYKAVSVRGENIEGTYTAKSKNEVVMMLKENQNYPVSIQESVSKDIRDFQLLSKVKTKDIAVFCRQFYTMLNSGITIIQCLDILRQQVENKKLKKAVGEVYEDVQKGLTFSEALKKHPVVFPQLMTYMVAAGEVSGSLDIVMDRLSTHYEKENKIQNKVKGAMIYPIILSLVSAVTVIFLLTFVMPTFLSMFQSSGVALPLPTRMLLSFSEAIKAYWYVFIIVSLALFYGVKRFVNSEEGRLEFDKFKLSIPLINKLNQKIISARFSRTLSTLLISGIPLLQSLENVANSVGNRYAAEGIMKAMEDIQKGADIATPIKQTGLFPPMLDNMIRIGEESGTLDEILDKTANFYDEEVDFAISKMTTMLEPIMIVFMAIIIGFIVIAMVLPMFDMMQTVQ
ncbi:type II secretion system F family protein [Serpentinicella alkaliphila]|uniref:Type IV pilus assembly protein PilC n=1 Tax=Serpentinicella alkaliphila TaxID=1734049 RepID=A0A4R2TB15_9FIRM|nr:type II secretion system F family protein [Serpentinicella alkaliphila]QUH26662.1 type II secretion system F family protein [Serpentinicella alkaliphila]TCQ00540.1 type IV pilus assembly protein PilC [Serpentinicella alkaliphila]